MFTQFNKVSLFVTLSAILLGAGCSKQNDATDAANDRHQILAPLVKNHPQAMPGVWLVWPNGQHGVVQPLSLIKLTSLLKFERPLKHLILDGGHLAISFPSRPSSWQRRPSCRLLEQSHRCT